MEIIKIEAPSLDSAQYGQGIVTAVENINKNFNMLNNPAFEKGDDAAPVKSAVVDLEKQTISGIDGDFSRKILDGITEALKLEFGKDFKNYYQFSQFNMYYNDLDIPTESYNFEEFIKIYLLGFSPLYVYDKKYYGLSTYSDETINKTGAYTIQYDRKFILEELSGYPKLNFIGNQWVWQIDSLKIDARGPKGEDGRDGSTYFVSIDENNVIKEINGRDPQENAQYIDQVAFALSNDDNVTIWIGYIKESEGNLVFESVKPLTAEFTDKNFLECLSHIGGNIINVSPGLFVPVDKYTDGTGPAQEQRVHMIYDSGGDTNLRITPTKLTYENNKLNWDKKSLGTGNLTIDYNTNISGNLTANSAKISGDLTTKSAVIGGNTTINSDGINTNYAKISGTLEAKTDIKTGTLNVGSANISGNLTTNSTKIGENTTINSDGIETNYIDVDGTLNARSASISGAVNGVNIGKASIITRIVNGANCKYSSDGTDYTFVNWYITCIKKNGWVKMIIRPTSNTTLPSSGTPAGVATTYWDFNIFTNSTTQSWLKDGHNRSVKPVKISGNIILDKEYKPLSNLYFCGTCEESIAGWEDKPSFIKYVLLQENGELSLQMYYSDIYRNDGGRVADKHFYSPYLEFTYPTND